MKEKIGQGEYGHVYSSTCSNPRLLHKYSALKEIKLPLRHSKTGKIVPVRLEEFSEIRLLPHLHNEKAARHNILQHLGLVKDISILSIMHVYFYRLIRDD